MSDFITGTVDRFDDERRRGYIAPTDPQYHADLLQFSHEDCRDSNATFRPGDTVFFRLEHSPRGVKALDVYPATDLPHDDDESVSGTVDRIVGPTYGFIRLIDGREAFFHQSSTVGFARLPAVGTEVACRVVMSPKGLQAREVAAVEEGDAESHDAIDDSLQPPSTGISPNLGVYGTVRPNPRYDRGFAFIDLPDNRTAFFHVSQLEDQSRLPPAGAIVSCDLEATEKGLVAKNVHRRLFRGVITRGMDRGFGEIKLTDGRLVIFSDKSVQGDERQLALGTEVECEPFQAGTGWSALDVYIAGHPSRDRARDLLAQAILARDARKYDEAARLYDRGLSENPSIQLVLSYAAMEKNRNQRERAMHIYEAGIKRFPKVAKLREDAGILAASLGNYRKAIDFFKEALHLCRTTHQGGEKGVLLGLARTYYRMGSLADVEQAERYFGLARSAFSSSVQMPSADELAYQLAKIRLQHHRGNLTFQFLKSAGFRIVRASMHDQRTSGADFVVSVDKPELIESYGLNNRILVRCMFKADVTHDDIEQLDTNLGRFGSSGIADDQVALLIVSSVASSLQKTLYRRIEERRPGKPSIIPISQSTIESSADPIAALREILDQWLYRRDLFALNSPVVGRRFFGREKALAELREAIATAVPLGIFGLRKVGKTSLLKETERRLSDSGDIVAYMDLLRVPSESTDVRWLYWRISNQLRQRAEDVGFKKGTWRLGGEFADFLAVPSTFPVSTAFDADVTSLLRTIAKANLSPRPKVVLLLDEIERLLPTQRGKADFTGFFDFFAYFRGLCQETNDFVLIITGANAAVAEASQFNGMDNPVFNFFKEVYLQLLDLNECKLMIKTLGRGMGILFDDPACEAIHELTGGHPFFSRQLCSFLAGRHADRPLMLTRPLVEDAVNDYLHFAGKDFREIFDRLSRDYPLERDICLMIAKSETGVAAETVSGLNSVRHLAGYQIAEVRNGQIVLTMDLMRAWLQSEAF